VCKKYQDSDIQYLHNITTFTYYLELLLVTEYDTGGACSMYGDKRNTCRILVGKPEVKGPFAGLRRRWECNIETALKQIGWKGMD